MKSIAYAIVAAAGMVGSCFSPASHDRLFFAFMFCVFAWLLVLCKET